MLVRVVVGMMDGWDRPEENQAQCLLARYFPAERVS